MNHFLSCDPEVGLRNLRKDVSRLYVSYPIQQTHAAATPVFEVDLANLGILVGERGIFLS